MAMTLSKRQSPSARAVDRTPDFQASFEALFRQHWERLCGLLVRIVGDRAEAEDLVVETFVRLYRRPPANDDNLGGWLYRVATNMGLNALRARKRRQTYEQEAGQLALEMAPSEDPAAAAEQALERRMVRDTLQALKPRSAQVLLLRHSGLSYAEIAAAIGVAPSSVGTLLARAESEFEDRYNQMHPSNERRRL
jgi:RNA polymerase sigma-70 factor (ECF subfamily)